MFCPKCGKETADNQAFCASCGAPLTQQAATPESPPVGISPKSRLATTLLAWFLGEFGAHRFYIGKIGSAVVMLILALIGWATVWFLVGIPFLVIVGIWSLVDFIFAVAGKMRDSKGLLIEKW
ncbi:MAG: TM2 domain-containing protein [Dehalococcoidia bacterium]|nr:TM2 domain-containing protein [Dehalococcoidia bacterium]